MLIIPHFTGTSSSSRSKAPSYILDQFSGTSNALLSSRPADTGQTWTVSAGAFEVDGTATRIRATAAFRGVPSIAYIDMKKTDVSVEMNFNYRNQTTNIVGVIVRYVDNNNYYRIQVTNAGNGFRIIQRLAGAETIVGTFNNAQSATNIKATIIGNKITAINGSATITATMTNFLTSTKFGIYNERSTNVNDVIQDNYDYLDNIVIWPGEGLQPPNALNPFSLEYPQPYEVYQRTGVNADIKVKGTILNTGGPVTIEGRFKSNATWTTIATNVQNSFTGQLASQTGQGLFELRIASDTSKTIGVFNVGIGDVYIIAGQSNASGRGDFSQSYTHATLKAGIFKNSYKWAELADPTDSSAGQVDLVTADVATGSYWPLLATQMMAARGVPVAFVPCAIGGLPISVWATPTNHQDRTTAYGSMIYRALQVFGVKAVLWHQGESDAVTNGFTTGAVYKPRLKALADSIFADLGVKTVVAKIHYWTEAPNTTIANVEEINQAMADAVAEDSNLLMGPDFHTPTDVTSGLHLLFTSQLQDAADRWWVRLNALGI